MKCPNDQNTLLITERSGVEIDYCPECRGVWLDRGELDKIIDKNEALTQPIQPAAPATPLSPAPQPHYAGTDERHSSNYSQQEKYNSYDSKHYKKKKRESFLGDLFDFGD